MRSMSPEFFRESSFLVTGGTGSIGSEIVRQLLDLGAVVVRIFSRDETKQYHLQEELGSRSNLRYLIGDVRDGSRLRRAMQGIDYVFHAAALKHVPSCEYNPFEAVQTNVYGTQQVLQAALEAGVKRVVTISTDKAVSPVSTMGATKLLAEKIVSSSQSWTKGHVLCSVRFGNVLGSRGSITQLVRKQVQRGGPVTLTDPAMTRFMMPIPKAVGLVLEALCQSRGGEMFILRMPALKVCDLLQVLVEEWSSVLNLDPSGVEIKTIGKRPGEKLHEALMTAEEAERAEMGDEVFVIPPSHVLGSGEPIAPEEYLSDRAPLLDVEGIRTLLRDAGLFKLS